MRMIKNGLAAVIFAAALWPGSMAWAASPPVNLVIDGAAVKPEPAPFIQEGRTLVPFRAVLERLGAQVDWDEATRTVTASKGDRWVSLRIDDVRACLSEDCSRTITLDVPARIVADRTFVPVRFVAESLGAFVDWDPATRTVIINGDGSPGIPAGSGSVTIATVQPGQMITGTTTLQVQVADSALAAQAREIRFIMLRPETGRGTVVARGSSLGASYQWLPDPAETGQRILFAGLYDAQGRYLDGASVPVTMAVLPSVTVTGIPAGGQLGGTVELTAQVNFRATHVTYELLPAGGGPAVAIADADPYGPFPWTPQVGHSGSWSLRAVAHDRLGRGYPSPAVPVHIAVEPRVSLTGVAAGHTVQRPVTLGVAANFPVQEVRYVLRDPATGAEEMLAAHAGAAQHRWLPNPGQNGARELVTLVVDTAGRTFLSNAVPVTIAVAPSVFIETVGPQQVLAGSVDLRAIANVPLTGISYRFISPSGAQRVLTGGADAQATYKWTPAAGDGGQWQLQATATTSAGTTLTSEALPVRVHTGPLHSAKPVIAKDRFKDFAAALAGPSQARTGMSAAVQVAQAILETGWGQSSPVDKYTGQVSNNLFGIKGEGPAGSVTSNTWEEYHGVVFRVDAAFRAYHSLEQSWDDHKSLLLTRPRYEQFRAVMHDGIQGAWALRRAGYATDSQYPVKLINLMKQHNLFELEEVSPW